MLLIIATIITHLATTTTITHLVTTATITNSIVTRELRKRSSEFVYLNSLLLFNL